VIATRRLIRELREKARMRIDRDLEALILERLGTEPYPHTYTEQDLFEQIRKLVMCYGRTQEEALPEEVAKWYTKREGPKGGEAQ